MNITKTLKNADWLMPILVSFVALMGIFAFNGTILSDSASAQAQNAIDGGTGVGADDEEEKQQPKTSILPSDLDFMGLLVFAIWIMTAGIGVLAVGGIVWGAILYSSAGDSQEKAKKGIEVIKNVVMGLILYIFMFAIINFLIPGGVIT